MSSYVSKEILQMLEKLKCHGHEEDLCEIIRKIGGIILNENSGTGFHPNSVPLKCSFSLIYFLTSRVLEVLSKTQSEEVLREVLKLIRLLAFREDMNYLLRQLGALHCMNRLLQESSNSSLVNEIAQIIDTLKKSASDTVHNIGFGFHYEEGRFDVVIRVKQDRYDNVGMAWKIWDASIWLSQWIFDNKELFVNKTVLEMGSGCGLCGVVCSLYASQVIMSDYLPQIEKSLKTTIKLNAKLSKNLPVTAKINWNSSQIVQQPSLLSKKGVDIVIGADIFFQPQLSEALAKSIDLYLSVGYRHGRQGVFYGASSSQRIGISQFVSSMETLGYEVRYQLPGNTDKVIPDLDNIVFFSCSKRMVSLEEDDDEEVSDRIKSHSTSISFLR